jgi:YtkA-like protein
MKVTTTMITLVAVILIEAGCGGAGPAGAGADKVIKSTKSGDMTITLANATGELKNGESDIVLSFADPSGKPVDVGAASLTFHMPAMGGMAEMNNEAALTTTENPGRYRARVNIEMAGTWEAVISYEGPHGTGRATMSVNAK